MAIAGAFFYLFSALAIASGFMVIAARNPVHAVLFLILTFFNAAGLFLLLGAEFLAMILIIVYVGAVAVLFLFVVMMLDVDFSRMREGFLQYLPLGALVGLIMLVELVLGLGAWIVGGPPQGALTAVPTDVSNTAALGRLLYTDFIYYFQAAGMILLVAMIGAIVLTLHHKVGVRRQNIAVQVARDPKQAVELKTVKPGQGI